MTLIIKLGKKAKRILKKYINSQKAPYLSFCRRIERVKTTERVCAMTFDDGPSLIPPEGGKLGLTEELLAILKAHNAKGTFDVIGSTAENYPDICGKISTPQWGGTSYDHYPKMNADNLGGAAAAGKIIDKIIAEGHQITNHSYRHLLFGPKKFVYSKREYFENLDAVIGDLRRLHGIIADRGYNMTMSRPPHYVDTITGGFDSYDAYSLIGYNYLAASFDGAGWLPLESYEEEVKATYLPLKAALEKDPNALCGQIIFQKDGYNMALRTPVFHGLEEQLKLLDSYGYKVVTVEKLTSYSAFEDVGRDDPDYEIFEALLRDRPIAYCDNRLRADALMTRGELAMLLSPKHSTVDERADAIKKGAPCPAKDVKNAHKYSGAIGYCIGHELMELKNGKFKPDEKLSAGDLKENLFDIEFLREKPLTRRNVYKSFYYKLT